MKIERFEEIEGWKLARELTRMVDSATKQLEFSKDFGLKDQIQRAAGSAMHNMAEGFDGGSDAEFARFLRYAQRSCTEVKSQLYAALDQEYISDDEFNLYLRPGNKNAPTHWWIHPILRKRGFVVPGAWSFVLCD